MRLIDADALKIDYGFTWDDITPTHEEMYSLIDRQQTIEERKTGRWVMIRTYENNQLTKTEWRCSECGAGMYRFHQKFCHECGAWMTMEGEDDATD